MSNQFNKTLNTNIGTTETTVYSTGATTRATVIGINIANTSANTVYVDIKLRDETSTTGYIVKGAEIPARSALAAMGGDQKLVMDEAALQAIRDGLQFKGELPTLGLDPELTGQLDTSMADLTTAIYVLIGAMATLGAAFAAYQAGGVGNLIGNVAGAVGGRRRRTGFGGDKAPRAGSKAAGDAAEKAGRKRKTDADIDAQRKRIAEGPKPRKAKPETDTSKPKQPPRRAPGAAPTTPQKQPPPTHTPTHNQTNKPHGDTWAHRGKNACRQAGQLAPRRIP